MKTKTATSRSVLILTILALSGCEKQELPLEVVDDGRQLSIMVRGSEDSENCINMFTVFGHTSRSGPAVQNLMSVVIPPESCLNRIDLVRHGEEYVFEENGFNASNNKFVSFYVRDINGRFSDTAVFELDNDRQNFGGSILN